MINISEDYQEAIRNATLFNDVYMNVFFKDQPKLVQFILCLILEKPDLTPDPVSKETRMDITATDGAGKLYDIEFQTVLEKDLIERQRYYHSQIDHDMLKKGNEYAKLPETYVLFICRGDAAGNKKPIDQFENKNKDGIPLNDGRHTIFINADHEGDWRLKDLMEDFKCPDPKQMRHNEIKERTTYLKEKEEGLMILTPEMEKFRNNAVKEGIKEGIRTIICNSLKKGKSPEAISDIIDVPVDEIRKIEQEMNTKPE